MKRLQKQITPSQALAEEISEEKASTLQLIRENESHSDLRTDLHKKS